MQAEEIFLEAIDRQTPSERKDYLDGACGNDVALRAQVEALLRSHQEAGSFLNSPLFESPATIDQPLAERPGTQIGPYKLLQQIGEGGMGVVYMAEQTEPIARRVALKIIKPGMDTRQVIARFEAERQALAMMDHVNIARVLDAGTTPAGRPYFVMELVNGVPITRYCDDNHFTPRQRLELFVPVCQAIQHAHQKGIIHRDIKPSNVMVTLYDGKPVPKVIDFGVAKATEQPLTERTLFTQYGAVVGTLEYMSPEQAEMSALGVDTRSDIYSLGVLLYELLTGNTPLTHLRMKEGAYAEILRMIKEEEPPKPSTRLSDSGEALASISANRHTEPAKLTKLVRGELDWIVMKCLEKDRGRRYETANAFAADVQRYLADETVLACPPTAWYRVRKFGRRNKRILATVGLLALALITGTVVSAWQAIRATEAEGLAQTRLQAETEAQNATREQLRLTEQAEGQATRRLYDARLAQAKAGSLSRRIGQRFGSLDALAEATKIGRDLKLPEEHFLDLRNAAIACLALPDLRIAKEWPGRPVGTGALDFAGTPERYARADPQGVVSIHRVADDVEIYRLDGMGPGENWRSFSPDGQFLAHYRGRVRPHPFQVWKLTGKEPVMLLEDPTDTFAFSPESRQLARALPDGSLRLYDLPSGREIKQLEAGPRVWMLAFHPKESQLALSCATGVLIRDLDTGKVLTDLAQPGAEHLAWHPDGKTLAVVGGDRIVHMWDVAVRKEIARLEGHKSDGIHFAYNHAGDLLASGCWDGILRLWNPRTGQQLFHTPAGVSYYRFSSDDQLLAGGVDGDKVRIWEVAAASGYRTLVRESVESKGYYFTSAIHPDGRLLAVGMADGADLWDLATGKHLTSIKLPTQNNHLLFGRSGELLTSGNDHLRRWPVQPEPGSGMVRIGPPQDLPVPAAGCLIASSADGQVLASAQYDEGGLVLHRDRPDQPITLGPHADVRYIAVSPDGRWVATGSHSGTKVKVWHAQSGKLERELPVETGSRVSFSPNGKWLATTGDGCRLWAVDSWQAGPHIGGGGNEGAHAFTLDGKLLAVETGSGVVRLVDPDTGREYARLEDPNQDRAGALTFSRDGAQLVATNNDSHSIHVWDLRAIRQQLAKMRLDWDLPAYPPRGPDNGRPLRVQIVLGAGDYQQQALGHLQAKQWDKSIADYSKAIELDPNRADAHNGLGYALYKQGKLDEAIASYRKAIKTDPKSAWAHKGLSNALVAKGWDLANHPDPKLRDPKRAVELGKEAVEIAPQSSQALQYFGWIQYRAGNWADHQAEARRRYEQADKLVDSRWPVRPSHYMGQAIWAFRAEARELIAAKDSKE